MSFKRKSTDILQPVKSRRSNLFNYTTVITRLNPNTLEWEVEEYSLIAGGNQDCSGSNNHPVKLENLREFDTFKNAMTYHNELMSTQELKPCQTLTL